MRMITAAFFDEDNNIVQIMDANPETLNLNIVSGRTWREIPMGTSSPDLVPDFETLERHPGLPEGAR